MGLALVTRIPNLTEAQIAAGALRSAGIAAEVFDGNFGAMEAPVIEGLGGYRLMAPEAEVIAAREALRALRAEPMPRDPDEDGPWTASLAKSRQARVQGLRWVLLAMTGGSAALWLLRLLTR